MLVRREGFFPPFFPESLTKINSCMTAAVLPLWTAVRVHWTEGGPECRQLGLPISVSFRPSLTISRPLNRPSAFFCLKFAWSHVTWSYLRLFKRRRSLRTLGECVTGTSGTDEPSLLRACVRAKGSAEWVNWYRNRKATWVSTDLP